MTNNKTDLSVDPSIAPCGKQSLTKTPLPFTAQGYFKNNYYFFVKEKNRVISIKSHKFTQSNLLELARVSYWREFYGTEDKRFKSGVNWNDVETDLVEKCLAAGEFQGARIRSRIIRGSVQAATPAKSTEVA